MPYPGARRNRGAPTGHRAVTRDGSMDPERQTGTFSVPGHQPSADPMTGPVSVPPLDPGNGLAAMFGRNTGIAGGRPQQNPIMEYLQRMLLNVRPR
jgi:hypothetical protein